MENIRIALQYEPASMQDQVHLIIGEKEEEEKKPLPEDEMPDGLRFAGLQPQYPADLLKDEIPDGLPGVTEAVSADEKEIKPEPELVDFHLTEPAISSLKDTVTWSKIIVVCTSVFLALEVLVLCALFLKFSDALTFNARGIVEVLNSGVSLCLNFWVIRKSVLFNRAMDQAIKYNDNPALEDGFRHQEMIFKWILISMAVSIGSTLLSMILFN